MNRAIPCDTCLSRDLRFRLLTPGQTCPGCGAVCPERGELTVREIWGLVREGQSR